MLVCVDVSIEKDRFALASRFLLAGPLRLRMSALLPSRKRGDPSRRIRPVTPAPFFCRNWPATLLSENSRPGSNGAACLTAAALIRDALSARRVQELAVTACYLSIYPSISISQPPPKPKARNQRTRSGQVSKQAVTLSQGWLRRAQKPEERSKSQGNPETCCFVIYTCE